MGHKCGVKLFKTISPPQKAFLRNANKEACDINGNSCWCQGTGSLLVHISGLTKTSRPGKPEADICFKAYPHDRRLCVYTYLKVYLKRTLYWRGKHSQLFVCYGVESKPASRDTIKRWLNDILTDAGIDMERFKPHSTRAASTSAAYAAKVPVDVILRTAGWSGPSTFQRFYNKRIDTTYDFQEANLNRLEN